MYAQRAASPEDGLEQTIKQATYQSTYKSTFQTTNQLADHLQNQSIKQSDYPLVTQTMTKSTFTVRQSSPESTTILNQPAQQVNTFVARAASPIDPLEREQREIDRRRARLEDRRQRVLHAKTRLIGVDVNGLDEQIRIKQSTEQSNLAMERMYNSMRVAHAGQLTQLAYEQSINQSSERLALAFTHQQQAAEKRARESLEQALSQATPNVETTFLSFPGEDLLYNQRMTEQQKQQADWASKQIEEKRADRSMQRSMNEAYDQQQQRFLQLQREDDLKRAAAIKQTNNQTATINQQLAREKANEATRLRSIDQSIKQSELQSTFNDRFMVEDSFDRDGNRGYCFKGLTQSERQAILDEQRDQAINLSIKRQRESDEKRQYDDMQDHFQRTMILNDIEKREKEARARLTLKEEHERQAREKNAREQYLNAVVYTNPVKEEYFAQFGTSAR